MSEEVLEQEEKKEEDMFVKVADLEAFMTQVNVTLMSIVNGINQTVEELKRSKPSDDNEN